MAPVLFIWSRRLEFRIRADAGYAFNAASDPALVGHTDGTSVTMQSFSAGGTENTHGSSNQTVALVVASRG
jgi:hypothetical protein